MQNKYRGRPLEEISERVVPVLRDMFKKAPGASLSRLEILGSFCEYGQLGDLTVQETVNVIDYLINKKVIIHSYFSYRLAENS